MHILLMGRSVFFSRYKTFDKTICELCRSKAESAFLSVSSALQATFFVAFYNSKIL